MFRESPRKAKPAPDRAGVVDAAEAIAAVLPPTPLLPFELDGIQLWAKAEVLQPVGAFKIRGGWWRLSEMTPEQRENGVVAVSSGNHAQGVAWAARKLGIAATIVMPNDAPDVKLDATRAMGAEIILYDRPGGEDRDVIASALCDERGCEYVHAYADPWVIEGQGSAGIEITAQLGKQPPMILACCGGGGLSAGLSLACPDSEIVPVEPEGWDDVALSLAAGEIIAMGPDAPHTACDALQTPQTAPINFAVLKERVKKGLAVSEAEIREAQRFAFKNLKLVVEPGGAAALAAVLAGKVPLQDDMVIMLTGGNADPVSFAKVIASEN